jgi:hypothetical protein
MLLFLFAFTINRKENAVSTLIRHHQRFYASNCGQAGQK